MFLLDIHVNKVLSTIPKNLLHDYSLLYTGSRARLEARMTPSCLHIQYWLGNVIREYSILGVFACSGGLGSTMLLDDFGIIRNERPDNARQLGIPIHQRLQVRVWLVARPSRRTLRRKHIGRRSASTFNRPVATSVSSAIWYILAHIVTVNSSYPAHHTGFTRDIKNASALPTSAQVTCPYLV